MKRSGFADQLIEPAAAAEFDSQEIAGLPDPVRRYFTAAVAPGTRLAGAARFRMRGSIKLGGRWLRFRASQVESPHRGFIWTARVAGIISGYDRYAGGAGEMNWRLLGLVRVAHAAGPDVTRSAAGRAGAEAIWVPTALLPRYGVTWTVVDDTHLVASYLLDRIAINLRLALHHDGQLSSVVFDRWGDPDSTGEWGLIPFGFEVTAHTRFAGISIPASGRAGWYFGTDRWAQGEFFRCQITDYQLLTAPVADAG